MHKKYDKLIFIIIGERQKNYTSKTVKGISKFKFDQKVDIIDTKMLINIICDLDFDKLKSVALFIERLFAGEGYLNELPFHAWYKNQTVQIEKYVEVEEWNKARKTIDQFINFDYNSEYPLLTILGSPGVGKTRFVAETIRKNNLFANSAIYQENTQDIDNLIKTIVKRNENVIVVVDECDIASRARIKELMQGHTDRIRVIAIDNRIEEKSYEQYAPEIVLEEMNISIVEKILEENFASIVPSIEHRFEYARYSEGFVNFAAFLCKAHTQIVSTESVAPISSLVIEYVMKKMKEDEYFRIIKIVSLLIEVGYYGEYNKELSLLVNYLSDNCHEPYIEAKIKEKADEIKRRFGFIRIRNKRFYVTPKLLAEIAFKDAVDEWIKDDLVNFYQNMPKEIQNLFYKRLKVSGRKEDLSKLADFFRSLATEFKPEDFKDSTKTYQMIKLVELNPDEFLPILHRNISETSDEILLSLNGFTIITSGPRRELLWLLEKLKAFQTYFQQSMDVIFKLAITENEKNVGNNATSMWLESFRLYHSHTSVSYKDRLKYLEKFINSKKEANIKLAFDALRNFNPRFTTEFVKTVVVSGKVAPEQWRPKDWNEVWESYDAFFELLERLVKSNKEIYVNNAWDIYVSEIKHLIPDDPEIFIPKLKEFVSKFSETMSEQLRVKIVEKLEYFIDWYDDHGNIEKSYLDEVREIVKEIKPTDLHNRLLFILNTSNYSYILNEEKQKEWILQVKNIAKELFSNKEELRQKIPVIYAKEAVNSVTLGVEIGILDEKADLWESVINWVLEYKITGFTRGYFSSIIYHHKILIDELNLKFDEIQNENPDISFELYMIGGFKTKAVERTIQLVQQKKLKPHVFNNFIFGVNKDPLSIKQYQHVLEILISSMDKDEENIHSVILRFIEYRLSKEEDDNKNKSILDNNDILKLIWRFMDSLNSIKGQFNGDEHVWGSILIRLSSIEFKRAVKLLTLGLVSKEMYHRDETEDRLKEIINKFKDDKDILTETFNIIGNLMLTEKEGVLFYFNTYKKLFKSFPTVIVTDWLSSAGVKGAMKIARHLPEPYIDQKGEPFVPELTMFVLENFGENERVFREFCIGFNNPKMRSGDIASKILVEIEEVKKFANHEKAIVRKWAEQEIQSKKGEYKHWKKIQDEEVF